MKTEIKAELFEKLITHYQSFTKWVLRHDKDIAKSQRGKDFLNDIDETEAQIRIQESVPATEITDEMSFFDILSFLSVNKVGQITGKNEVVKLLRDKFSSKPATPIEMIKKAFEPIHSRQTVTDEMIEKWATYMHQTNFSYSFYDGLIHGAKAMRDGKIYISPKQ